jgi:hypothetical protein
MGHGVRKRHRVDLALTELPLHARNKQYIESPVKTGGRCLANTSHAIGAKPEQEQMTDFVCATQTIPNTYKNMTYSNIGSAGSRTEKAD